MKQKCGGFTPQNVAIARLAYIPPEASYIAKLDGFEPTKYKI